MLANRKSPVQFIIDCCRNTLSICTFLFTFFIHSVATGQSSFNLIHTDSIKSKHSHVVNGIKLSGGEYFYIKSSAATSGLINSRSTTFGYSIVNPFGWFAVNKRIEITSNVWITLQDAEELPDGSVMISGTSTNAVGTNPDGVLLGKISSSGQMQWLNIYGIPYPNSIDYGGGELHSSPSGNIIFSGRIKSSVFTGLYLLEVGPSGAIISEKFYPCTKYIAHSEGHTRPSGQHILSFDDLGYMTVEPDFTCITSAVAYTSHQTGYRRSVIEGVNGDVVILSGMEFSPNNGMDVCLTAFDVNDNFRWMKVFTAPGDQFVYDLLLNQGKYIVIGEDLTNLHNTIFMEIDPSGSLISVKEPTSDGQVFNMRRTVANEIIAAGKLNTSVPNLYNSSFMLTDDNFSNMCLNSVGGYSGINLVPDSVTVAHQSTVIPGFSQTQVSPVSYTAISLPGTALGHCVPLFTEEISASNNVSIFPNPANDFISFAFDSEFNMSDAEILVTDLRGARQPAFIQENRINISRLDPGMYFISIRSDNRSLNSRFMKISH